MAKVPCAAQPIYIVQSPAKWKRGKNKTENNNKKKNTAAVLACAVNVFMRDNNTIYLIIEEKKTTDLWRNGEGEAVQCTNPKWIFGH